MLINVDLKQIEVCILAHLSGDKAFIKLLMMGVDIYKYFASIMYNKPEDIITEDERNSLKVPILGISYGKGYIKLSKETGKTEEWCKEFIDNFYAQFPAVKQLHARWIEEVNKTGMLRMWSGINLRFKYYEKTFNEEYNCWFKAGYKPQEIKNYPVQHSAFVVFSLFLSTFWRLKAIYNRHKYLLIGTVHDSFMLDCRPEYVEDAKKDINDVLDMIPSLMLQYYNQKIEVPLKIDVSVGMSWYELT